MVKYNQSTMLKRKRGEVGLSSFENLMALAIIGIIIGFAIYLLLGHQARQRDDQRRLAVAAIQHQVRLYFASHGDYPASLSQVTNLPNFSGDYVYAAFKPGAVVSPNSTTNCDDRYMACVNYVIYTDRMEKADNPYFVRSY